MVSLEDLAQSVIEGQENTVKECIEVLLDTGKSPLAIINEGLISGMNIVGGRFREGEMYVPEVLMSAKSMNAGLEMVKPLLADNEFSSKGKILLGTVKGDLHDIGKNLVGMLMESGGFEVINLGVDVPAEKFVQAIKEYNPNVIGMSALLTTTMPEMRATIYLIEEQGLRDKVKIIVGGAPVSHEFAKTIGADGYAPDAAAATDLCKSLLAN